MPEYKISVLMTGDAKSLEDAIRRVIQAEREVDKSTKSMGATLRALAGVTIAGVGIRELANFATETVNLSARAQSTEVAFTNLSGSLQAAQANMEAMRLATRGQASEMDQQAIASQLLGMRIVDNANDLERVTEVSRRLGAAFRGLGAAEAANEFAIMMSNMSVMRLDSFGIASGRVRQRIDELMKSTQGMTREQAFFQATMEEADATLARLGPEQETAATSSGQLHAALTDLKVLIGNELAPTVIEFNTSLGQLVGTLNTTPGAFDSLAASANIATKVFTGQTLTLDDLKRAYESNLTVANSMMGANEQAQSSMVDLGGVMAQTSAATETQAAATRGLGASYDELQFYLEGARNSMATLGATMLNTSGISRVAAESIRQARIAAYDPMTGSEVVDARRRETRMRNIQAISQMEIQKTQEAERARQDAMQGMTSSFDTAASRIAGIVDSVLQPTLSEVWQPPTDAMPRMDEAARRAATIATQGFGSEWLGQLNEQFKGMSFWQPIADAMASGDEGALKAAATNLLSGPQVSQLWDKNVIIQRVKDELARQNMAESLKAAVMQELAAQGISASAAMVGAAMGGPGAGMGESIAGDVNTGIQQAMGEQDVGGGLISTIAMQVDEAAESKYALAVAVASGLWSELPAALQEQGNLLDLLIDQVMARLAASAPPPGATATAPAIPPVTHIGGYQSGGTVPGPRGMPQLAVVHGGETVVPAGGGGAVTIEVPIYLDGARIGHAVGKYQGQKARSAARLGGRARL